MILTKKGYIDCLDYSKIRNQEERDRFERVRELFYVGKPAPVEELNHTIQLIKRFDKIDLELER